MQCARRLPPWSARGHPHSHPLFSLSNTEFLREGKAFPFWESPTEARENPRSMPFLTPLFLSSARKPPREQQGLTRPSWEIFKVAHYPSRDAIPALITSVVTF